MSLLGEVDHARMVVQKLDQFVFRLHQIESY
jgi:hypothetical protein